MPNITVELLEGPHDRAAAGLRPGRRRQRRGDPRRPPPGRPDGLHRDHGRHRRQRRRAGQRGRQPRRCRRRARRRLSRSGCRARARWRGCSLPSSSRSRRSWCWGSSAGRRPRDPRRDRPRRGRGPRDRALGGHLQLQRVRDRGAGRYHRLRRHRHRDRVERDGPRRPARRLPRRPGRRGHARRRVAPGVRRRPPDRRLAELLGRRTQRRRRRADVLRRRHGRAPPAGGAALAGLPRPAGRRGVAAFAALFLPADGVGAARGRLRRYVLSRRSSRCWRGGRRFRSSRSTSSACPPRPR